MRIWLILAILAGVLTFERLNALLGSAAMFPGISVLGIVEVLLPAEATVVSFIRWQDARTGHWRSWGWLLLAVFASFVIFLVLGTALLASQPPGLAPSGLMVVAVSGAVAAVASWLSARGRRPAG